MPSKLLVYNTETNQYGYIDWLYYRHQSATSGNWYTGNGFELRANYTHVPANLNFLALPDNKVCVVCGNRLYRSFRVTPTFSSYTLPAIYYADDHRIYIGTLDKGESTAFGTATINYKVEFEYWTGGDNWKKVERTGSWSTANWCGGDYYAGQPGYWRKSVELNPADATALMTELRVEMERFSTYYVTHSTSSGRAGSFPIAFFDSNPVASSAKSGQVMSFIPCLYKNKSLGAPKGIYTNTSDFNSIADFSASNEPYTVTSGIPDIVNYYEDGIPSILTSYSSSHFGGVAPSDVGEFDPESLTPSSIYTPGGTSSDPYSPYTGVDNPYTNDPLNSGMDTTSTSTPGTWVLPFDEVPDAPATVHSVDLGLYNVYALSAAQVKELANYLFSGVTELGENLVKLIWGSKRDVIISLYEFPLMITTQGTDTIRFIFDTDLAGLFHGKQLTSEYIPIDFGTIKVDRYSGTFYDFEPYTTLTLYIPYIGYVDLKPTEVVGSTLSIRGYVHLTTGELTVNVRSSRTGILGSYSGTIGRMLPLADADATDIYSSIIKTAASFGAVAVAGVGASSASATAASIGEPSTESVEIASANYVDAIEAWGAADDNVRQYSANMKIASHDYQRARNSYSEAKSKYNQVSKAASNSQEAFHDAISEAGSNALDAVTTGFNVSRGTVMTSSNGRLSPQRCFLRIELPHQNVSRNQKILGYPANSSDSLNSNRLHGYTELRTIELSIPRATLTEIQELENILKGGFYLP